MKITVIDNYDSFVFNLVRYLEENEQCEVSVMRNDNIDKKVLDLSDAILLSPGPGIPKEAGELMSIIHNYHMSKPILGVCLGHQAISEYFGCELIQNKRPLHGKSSIISHNKQSMLFQGIDENFQVGRYHSWSVNSSVSKDIQVLAETADHEIMSIRHNKLPIFGVQFHPESILTPMGRIIINNWVSTIQNESNEKITR